MTKTPLTIAERALILLPGNVRSVLIATVELQLPDGWTAHADALAFVPHVSLRWTEWRPDLGDPPMIRPCTDKTGRWYFTAWWDNNPQMADSYQSAADAAIARAVAIRAEQS